MALESKIKILVVEDSTVARLLLVEIINHDPSMEVIGTAENGLEAMKSVAEKRPHVVLMDIHMPHMDGIEATRRIMETTPLPIVICSATANLDDAVTSFRLMEAGAVACVEKPVGQMHADFESQARQLCRTVRLMSEVKVVRRWPRRESAASFAPIPFKLPASKLELVSIGASTGGPPVLQTILSALPKDFSLPILVVQHIAPGFLDGLVQWLNQTTGFRVAVATHGMRLECGHAYLAPDDFHVTVRSDGLVNLDKQELRNGLRPSVNSLFHSVAKTFGPHAVGVLLTGMGKDGAEGLLEMKDRGAMTIAQDRDTSVVFGMPGEAVSLGAAIHTLPPDQIASVLTKLACHASPNGD